MAQTIDARVKQKTGTAADFAGYTLLEGEIALVRSTANGPVINYKVGAGLFDSLPWSLQVPGTVASVSPSTDFGTLPAGLYLPDSDGTYDGTVSVDLSEGVTYLNWDGSTLTKQVYPINLSGYATTGRVDTVDAKVDYVDEKVELISVPTTNELDKLGIGSGLWATGSTKSANVNFISTDKIPTNGNETKTLSGHGNISSGGNRVVFFDELGEFISGIPSLGGGDLSPVTFTTPANARFYGVNIVQSTGVGNDPESSPFYNTVQVNPGEDVLPYEEYGRVVPENRVLGLTENYARRALFEKSPNYDNPILRSVVDFKVYEYSEGQQFAMFIIGRGYVSGGQVRTYLSFSQNTNQRTLHPVGWLGNFIEETPPTGLIYYDLCISNDPEQTPVASVVIDWDIIPIGQRLNEQPLPFAERSHFLESVKVRGAGAPPPIPGQDELVLYGESQIDSDKSADEYNRQLAKAMALAGVDTDWYGIEFDEEDSDPSMVTRIGSDMNLHTSLPIQSKMRRCVVDSNREVVYYLDEDDSTLKEDQTPAVLDGSDGDVMVEVPAFYFSVQKSGTVVTIRISEWALDGFVYSPKYYVSAFEAMVDRTNDHLRSVVMASFKSAVGDYTNPNNAMIEPNVSGVTIDSFFPNAEDYRGGDNNQASWDADNFLSKLGRPASNYTRPQLRQFALNRGAQYNIYLYDVHKALYYLMVTEFANRNLQATDIGVGTSNANYDAYHFGQEGFPIIPCGATLGLGNHTGSVFYIIPDCPETYDRDESEWVGGYDKAFPVASYRGIEHIYGHSLKVCDQLSIIQRSVNGVIDNDSNGGVGIGDSRAYYSKNPFRTEDEDVGGGTMQYVGQLASINYYIRDISRAMWGKDGHMLPTETINQSNTNTYYSDILEIHFGNTTAYTEYRVIQPVWGGRAGSGNFTGPFFLYLNHQATEPRASNVTRLVHR